jgi:hypothetical protein
MQTRWLQMALTWLTACGCAYSMSQLPSVTSSSASHFLLLTPLTLANAFETQQRPAALGRPCLARIFCTGKGNTSDR